ncbi:MAG TPA: hypothetical protein VLC95_18640 [Anaerolineae bacterium]|nr:hypothetical protein [Anaerolineae bacterium]
MSAWLKAGLVGGVVVAILNLLSIIPCVGLVTCFLGFLVYIGTGALAAYWMLPPRQAGPAAGQGAMAAALAGLIGGIVTTIISGVQMAVTDTATVLSQIPPESLEQLEAAGIDPAIFTSPGMGVGVGAMCCVAGIVIAAVLGAIGGAILAAVRAD